MRKIDISEKELKRLYLEEKKTQAEIAEIFNCSACTIGNRLKGYDVPIRKHTSDVDRLGITKKVLYELYWTNKLNQEEVAERLGLSGAYVGYLMRNYNIKTRKQDSNPCDIKKETLKKLYIDEMMTLTATGEKLGVSSTTVRNWLVRYGIKTRDIKETGRLRSKTTKQYKKEVLEKTNGKYQVIGEYKNSRTKILMKHNVCGHEYKVRPNAFNLGNRCPKCDSKKKKKLFSKSQREFEKEVAELFGEEYKVVGQYINAYTDIKIEHQKCGHVYETRPSNLLMSRGCPKCSCSYGEQAIIDYLEKKSYEYKKEYIFKNCKHKNFLRFDFAVFQKRKPKLLIEYDSKIHYENIEHFGGEEALRERQKRDKIKNEFCFKNKIPLIRIPYWERENIEPILERALNNVNRYSIYNIHN